MSNPRNAEIVRRLRSNAQTMRVLGEQNGIQAEFDFADLLDAACNVIEAGERDATALDTITEILNDNEWNADCIDAVAAEVWATGRQYEDRLS